MNDLSAAHGEAQPPLQGLPCAYCGGPVPPRDYKGGVPRKYCSRRCTDKAAWERKRDLGGSRRPLQGVRKRRPLPDAAKDAAWALRRDVERIERIFADDRFGSQKEEVTTLLRGHLSYAATVCQDLLGRIDPSTGE